jgi:hypothetical protein
LLNIFANEINLLHLSKRKALNTKFISMLEEYIQVINNKNIQLLDCCIVGGAALNALGIREADDVDFTTTENIRFSMFNSGVTKLSSKVDLVSFNYPRSLSAHPAITDNQLISCSNNHFFVRGIRFADPKIILLRKQCQRRDKDLRDLKVIAEYLDDLYLS